MLTDKVLYLITCVPSPGINYEKMVEEAIIGGVEIVQLRAKELSRKELMRLACSLREITFKYKIIFIINDWPDVALASQADGVHLGQDDLEITYVRKLMGDKIIGVSTHTLEEARAAQEKGADYIGVGPIFKTVTKPDLRPVGLDLIAEIKKEIKIPFFCLGGIDSDNIKQVIEIGGRRVAISSAICKVRSLEEIGKTTQNLKKMLLESKN
ncbi:thiamine phosphate synthase [bacterium]|nr:thiamine phosphate synthase [bacterium]